ncbi:uncharacterized protein LOC105702957 isoform X2 [Orussus abietinus]|uniref:uncharacterized protein LOC105702957 isoform X2 n=1 Tax=Orussus abietinus TaxID=222816 RepID=UPI000626779C|nr:uncharacterized protein LOC105702957 isoform X2 [Orussus abietinus]
MVSPSKAQHQEQDQPRRKGYAKEADRRSHVRLQKGSKPLERKTFYLDIKNHALSSKLEGKIKDLGGAIEVFLVRGITLVVSDRADKVGQTASSDRYKWGCTGVGSGGPPSLRSTEAPTPTPTPPTTPYPSVECPLSNSTNLRGQTAQRSKSRADAMLERALTQPQQCSVDPLKNAQNWGIPIWATDKLQAWLDKIYASLKDTDSLSPVCRTAPGKEPKVKHLKAPYLKFESFRRETRPVFLELPVWPKLNFDGDPGSCPFDKPQVRKQVNTVGKNVKENRGDRDLATVNNEKEMTRRPRTTAARARRTEQLASGYCEICRIEYRDLSKHVRSDQHVNFVRNDNNFLALDTLINSGASVEAFLKLNRAKDIGKKCNLFPNGDRALRNVGLQNKPEKTAKTNLDAFGVEDIKMVQCNGARRNINLKLSSPHNLRTRTKHESGHLLRSKGSPWHEVEKSEKFYDKFEGFTIKKRAKGTIWIEEDDPEEKCGQGIKSVAEENLKDGNTPLDNINGIRCVDPEVKTLGERQNGLVEPEPKRCEVNQVRQLVEDNAARSNPNLEEKIRNDKLLFEIKGEENYGSVECRPKMNGCMVKEECKSPDASPGVEDKAEESAKVEERSQRRDRILEDGNALEDVNDKVVEEKSCNGVDRRDERRGSKSSICAEKETKEEKPKVCKPARRGGRSSRGRPRLSVEERLIEDNRAYYKVEVLGSKLRSSTLPASNPSVVSKYPDEEKEKSDPAVSEKPVVVRFKRVRKSELSLLSDEAESFMFGEPRREDSSDSEGEQSSVLPKDTESDPEATLASITVSSPSQQETRQVILEEDSQDSSYLGRARKRRRTQAEALIMDNADYYKFETPGSRLRYQAPMTGLGEAKESCCEGEPKSIGASVGACGGDKEGDSDQVRIIYPSKPSAEVERLQFSFEAVPRSEPWYQTYRRQDEGAEFWHYFSEVDSQRPFLLPYEIENFHETLARNATRGETRRRGRGRGFAGLGRSPRKSPRCHASTLAIMSTIIRKREQQQQQQVLGVIEEEENQVEAPKSGSRVEVDEEIREMARSIDEMLRSKDLEYLGDFEDCFGTQGGDLHPEEDPVPPRGAPPNLLELLDNCHTVISCLENSSCASSECGEAGTESPLKRRKKRKNRTGWPGNKMKRKLQAKVLGELEGEREEVAREQRLQRLQEGGPLEEDVSKRLCSVPEVPEEDGQEAVSGFSEEKRGDLGDVREPQSQGDGTRDTGQKEGTLEGGGGSTEIVASERMEEQSPQNCDVPCESSPGSATDVVDREESSKASDVQEEPPRIPPERDPSPGRSPPTLDCHSENFPGEPENHKNLENTGRKDTTLTAILERLQNQKATTRNRHTTGSGTLEESRVEPENQEGLFGKELNSGLASRRNHANGSVPRRHQRDTVPPETPELETHPRKIGRKRQKKCPDVDHGDENCKRESYAKRQCMKSARRQNVRSSDSLVGLDGQDNEMECNDLSERISPGGVPSSELEQRRSSMEFQPVVRMMKIDDQVDMDHGVLSVTVASNRRLRSSGSSPKSNVQPPSRKFKGSRGQFGRWLKNS